MSLADLFLCAYFEPEGFVDRFEYYSFNVTHKRGYRRLAWPQWECVEEKDEE